MGFYYDDLNLPNGQSDSAQGAVDGRADSAVRSRDTRTGVAGDSSGFKKRLEWYLKNRPELAALVSRWEEPGVGERRLLSLLRGHRMKEVLRRMLDESEFLSDYGMRAVSRYHLEHPYQFQWNGNTMTVDYEPGESTSGRIRRELELARPDLVSGELSNDRVLAEVSSLLRRRVQNRMSDRVRSLFNHKRGCR